MLTALQNYEVKSKESVSDKLEAENKHTYGIEYRAGTIPSSVVRPEGARTR